MRRKRVMRTHDYDWSCLAIIIGIIVGIAFWTVVVWVAAHFIIKWW